MRLKLLFSAALLSCLALPSAFAGPTCYPPEPGHPDGYVWDGSNNPSRDPLPGECPPGGQIPPGGVPVNSGGNQDPAPVPEQPGSSDGTTGTTPGRDTETITGDAQDKFEDSTPNDPNIGRPGYEYDPTVERWVRDFNPDDPNFEREGYYYNFDQEKWVPAQAGSLDFFSQLDMNNLGDSDETADEDEGDKPDYEVTQGPPPEEPKPEEKPADDTSGKPDKPAKPGDQPPTQPDPDKDFNDKLKQREELQKKKDQLIALDKQLNKSLESLGDQAKAAADLAVAFTSKSHDDFKDFVKDYTSGKAGEFLQEKMIDKLGKYGKLLEKGLELKDKIEGAIETGGRLNDLATGDTEAKLNAAKDFLKDACPIGEEIDGVLTGAFNVLHGYELTSHAEELGKMLSDQYKNKAWILEKAGDYYAELGRLDEQLQKDPRSANLSDETKKQMNSEIEDSKFFRHDEPATPNDSRYGRPSEEKLGDNNPNVPDALKDLPAYFYSS